MQEPFQGNYNAYVTRYIVGAAVVLLMQVLVFFAMGELGAGGKVLVILLSLGLLAFSGYTLYKTFYSYRDEGWHYISIREIKGFAREVEEKTATAKLPRWFSFLEKVRDAYYLDMEWLERSTEQLEYNDMELRETLMGQAVWLSMVCDNPRLSNIRYALLCKGQVCEGDETDLDAIMRQLLPMEREGWVELLDRPRGVQTLCDCLRFDMVGMEPSRLSECLEWLLVRMNYNDLFEYDGDLSPALRRRIVQTVAYYGPEACSDSMKGYISRAGVIGELTKLNPGFRSHPKFKGLREKSGGSAV